MFLNARFSCISFNEPSNSDKKISLSVQGVDWELNLTEKIHNNINRMNELGIEVKVGTLVTVQYTLQDEIRTVEQISRLEAN